MVTTASNTVSVAFANNPTGATLGGTLSVTASQGVASFSNLTINKIGLRLHAPGLQQRADLGRHQSHQRDQERDVAPARRQLRPLPRCPIS